MYRRLLLKIKRKRGKILVIMTTSDPPKDQKKYRIHLENFPDGFFIEKYFIFPKNHSKKRLTAASI
jgi:translation elongation factor P/translation initiation factor 5A